MVRWKSKLCQCELTSPFTEGYCKNLADKIYEYYQLNGEELKPAA